MCTDTGASSFQREAGLYCIREKDCLNSVLSDESIDSTLVETAPQVSNALFLPGILSHGERRP